MKDRRVFDALASC